MNKSLSRPEKPSAEKIESWWNEYKKTDSIQAKKNLIEHYLPVVKYTVSRILGGPPYVRESNR